MPLRITSRVDARTVADLIRAFAALDKKAARKAARRAVLLGSRIIRDDAKARVPVRFGLLKKSLGSKVKAYWNRGFVAGIVGPRRGFRRDVGQMREANAVRNMTRRGMNVTRTPRYADPVKYAHLVEFGTRRSAPKPFMRPALDENRDRVIDIMIRTLQEALARARA